MLKRPGAGPFSLFRRLPGIARLAVGLEVFLGIGALYGGSQFILAPDGHLMGMSAKTLADSPFRSYLVPGLVLFTVVGIGPFLAAAITVGRLRFAPAAAVAVGLTLMGWITAEMVMIAGWATLLWAVYLALGTAIAGIGLAWRRYESGLPTTPGGVA